LLISKSSYSTLSGSTRIGIIGLGNVGQALANNILNSSLQLHAACDINPSALQSLPNDVHLLSRPKEVAECCDVVLTALPTPKTVKNVMLGEGGVLAGIRQGCTWIDHSTTDYHQTLQLAEKCKELGVGFLEAPVTGGMALLKQGLMTVLVSGDKQLYDTYLPLLKMSGRTVLYLGGLGNATITKVITNMLAAAHLVCMGEALMLAKRNNIDLKMFFEAVRFSAGNSYVIETEAPLAFNGSFNPDFSLELHCKDLALGRNIAQESGVPIKVHSLVEEIYNEAKYKYGDEKGSSFPAKLLQDLLGEKLQISGFEDWTYSANIVDGTMSVSHTTKTALNKAKSQVD